MNKVPKKTKLKILKSGEILDILIFYHDENPTRIS